jgi:hypothetical protein
MRYVQNPEIISSIRAIYSDGDETNVGDFVCGVSVFQEENDKSDATVQLDFRNLKKIPATDSLIAEVSLGELLRALASASINCDRA